MFIQLPPVQPDTTPKVAAVFLAANTTLGNLLNYDIAIQQDDTDQRPGSAHRTNAHLIKKGNLYTGQVNPSARTIPVGLRKSKQRG